MKHILSRFLVVFLALYSATLYADTISIKEAKMAEIKAFIAEYEMKVKIAEKNLQYTENNQEGMIDLEKQKNALLFSSSIDAVDTAMTDFDFMQKKIDVVMGITDENTRGVEIGALDSSYLSRVRGMYSHADFFQKQLRSRFEGLKQEPEFDDVLDTVDISINQLYWSLRLVNTTLTTLSNSLENPDDPELKTTRITEFSEYRAHIIEALADLRAKKVEILSLDEEEQMIRIIQIDTEQKMYDLLSAKAQLMKAQRLLIELEKNGDVELKSL